MGGNIKNKTGASKPTAQQLAAAAAQEQKKKEESLIIRITIAVVIAIAAIAACVLMLSHDFNVGREVLIGTYYAERRFMLEGENGSELSDIDESYAVSFYEDGRMIYKYESGNVVNYYEYTENDAKPYDGAILRYNEGKYADTLNVVNRGNGELALYCNTESMNFTVPDLVRCFGEEATLNMLAGVYNEDVCRLLIAGDYDSITDEQIEAMGVEREQLGELSFAIKNLPTVITLHKVSDDMLSRKNTLELWEEMNPTVSESDISKSDM